MVIIILLEIIEWFMVRVFLKIKGKDNFVG